MKRVIRLHFKPILFLQNYNVYHDNNNVSTGPMKTVTTYPMVVFFK